ncbi:hypothetical protein KR044_004667, partial [Drosophila immigrans]
MSQSKETGIGTDPDHAKKNHLDKREKVALKDLLQQRLLECGWRKDVEQKIRATLEERGLGNVTHEQLSAEIIPHVKCAHCIPLPSNNIKIMQARALVPEGVRKEMVMRVREALES